MWRGGCRDGMSVSPPLSSCAVPEYPAMLRFHTPLIEPDMQISRIRLSDRTSRLRSRRPAAPRAGQRPGARSARTGAGGELPPLRCRDLCACGVATDATASGTVVGAAVARSCPCLPESSSPSRATRDWTCGPFRGPLPRQRCCRQRVDLLHHAPRLSDRTSRLHSRQATPPRAVRRTSPKCPYRCERG